MTTAAHRCRRRHASSAGTANNNNNNNMSTLGNTRRQRWRIRNEGSFFPCLLWIHAIVAAVLADAFVPSSHRRRPQRPPNGQSHWLPHRPYGQQHEKTIEPSILQQPTWTRTRRTVPTRMPTSSARLDMSLVPLSVDDLETLVAVGKVPTGVQYASYFGRTSTERYGRILESSIISFLGVFFSYFLSFVLGGFVATIFGCLFLFWGILSPEFKALQRNWEFYGGRPLVDGDSAAYDDPERAGLYGALFLGRIDDVCVVEDAAASKEYDLEEFQDYTMEEDELEQFTGQPYLLRTRCIDVTGRTLQVHARLSEEYLTLQGGIPVACILLSTSPKFQTLAALTDVYVPDAECWIGDYPYLDRAELEEVLAEDDEIWDTLQNERLVVEDDGIGDESTEDAASNLDGDGQNEEEDDKVVVRRRG